MTQPAPNAAPAGGTPPADPAGVTPPNATPPANPAGGTQPASPPADPAAATPPAGDQTLGPAGLKALQEEREARKKLEAELAGLAPLKKLAAALGADPAAAGGGKTDVEALTERLTNHEKTLADERSARWRAEVANEKGLTPEEAARLVGATKEDLTADADRLVALFAARQQSGGAGGGPRTPAPDPSQGARGSNAAADLDARIAQAQKDNNWREVMRLQNSKLDAAKTT